jgi:hypothetical protein
VSLQFIESAVQIYPDVDRVAFQPTRQIRSEQEADPSTGPRKCRLCSQPAVFMIPGGLTCDEHAWQAAARLDWQDADPWVPIRIDRSNA